MKVGAILLLVAAVSASYAAVFSGRNAGMLSLLLHPHINYYIKYYIHWIICLLKKLNCTLKNFVAAVKQY